MINPQSTKAKAMVMRMSTEPRAYRSEAGGELGLQRAVLDDAVKCFLGEDKALRVEAAAWLMSDDAPEYPFSFAGICETFNLSASAVRAELQAQRRGAEKSFRRDPDEVVVEPESRGRMVRNRCVECDQLKYSCSEVKRSAYRGGRRSSVCQDCLPHVGQSRRVSLEERVDSLLTTMGQTEFRTLQAVRRMKATHGWPKTTTDITLAAAAQRRILFRISRGRYIVTPQRSGVVS